LNRSPNVADSVSVKASKFNKQAAIDSTGTTPNQYDSINK